MNLLFISYINRSGSTFFANEFSKYQSILVCPEAEVLFYYFIQKTHPIYRNPARLGKLLTKILQDDPKLKFWDLDMSDLRSLDTYQDNFDVFVDILTKYRDKVKPEATTILFKADILAYYYTHIPEEYYRKHNITIITIIRDGRSSYASQRETIGARKQKPMNRNPVKAARLWKKWIRFLADHKTNTPFKVIRYEELIKDFEKRFHELLVELDIGIDQEKCSVEGDLFERIPSNQKAMHPNVTKPPLKDNIDKWKNILPPHHIRIFEKIAGKELVLAGYELVNPKVNDFRHLFISIYYHLVYSYESSHFRRIIRRTGKFLLIRCKNFYN